MPKQKIAELYGELNLGAEKNAAGFIKDDTFHYFVSDTSTLPAAVNVLTLLGNDRKTKVYCSLPKGHWLFTYMKSQVKRASTIATLPVGHEAHGEYEPQLIQNPPLPKAFPIQDGDGPIGAVTLPIDAGHRAAQSRR